MSDNSTPIKYEYVGGGYFREKGIPVGVQAKIIHAPEYVKELLDKIKSLESIIITDVGVS